MALTIPTLPARPWANTSYVRNAARRRRARIEARRAWRAGVTKTQAFGSASGTATAATTAATTTTTTTTAAAATTTATTTSSSRSKSKKPAKPQSQKEKRRLKNRLSALASRKRKAAELDGLRTENKTLKRENEVLRERLAAALAANEAMVS